MIKSIWIVLGGIELFVLVFSLIIYYIDANVPFHCSYSCRLIIFFLFKLQWMRIQIYL